MNRSPLPFALATFLLATAGSAVAQQCKGLQDLQRQSSGNDVWSSLLQLIGADKEQVECGALTSVLDSVVNTRKAGGRKLEEDRGFNAQAAQSNLAKAQADPAVRKRLEKIRQDISDPTRRLVYEAAVFDDEGYYGARDLRINQLKQHVK